MEVTINTPLLFESLREKHNPVTHGRKNGGRQSPSGEHDDDEWEDGVLANLDHDIKEICHSFSGDLSVRIGNMENALSAFFLNQKTLEREHFVGYKASFWGLFIGIILFLLINQILFARVTALSGVVPWLLAGVVTFVVVYGGFLSGRLLAPNQQGSVKRTGYVVPGLIIAGVTLLVTLYYLYLFNQAASSTEVALCMVSYPASLVIFLCAVILFKHRENIFDLSLRKIRNEQKALFEKMNNIHRELEGLFQRHKNDVEQIKHIYVQVIKEYRQEWEKPAAKQYPRPLSLENRSCTCSLPESSCAPWLSLKQKLLAGNGT